MENNNPGKINRPAPKINSPKKPPVSMNKKTHFELKNRVKNPPPQPIVNKPIAYNSIIAYVVIGLILFVAAIFYLTSIDNPPKSNSKQNKRQPKEPKKEEPNQETGGNEGRALTPQEQKQVQEARQDIKDVAKVIDKYNGMSKEDITESDKTEIKNASEKMNRALATISEISERTGTPLTESTNNNRKKLTVMMVDLEIPR
ncbi:MAG: hypothetical protein AAB019_00765 [Planctomycetota bacterium]